jgi:hypothetical protein
LTAKRILSAEKQENSKTGTLQHKMTALRGRSLRAEAKLVAAAKQTDGRYINRFVVNSE